MLKSSAGMTMQCGLKTKVLTVRYSQPSFTHSLKYVEENYTVGYVKLLDLTQII
jgi:hypothetical protein